jgi:hypothetical protein
MRARKNFVRQPLADNPINQSQPTHEEIAFCAYLIWEREGRPQGCEEAHWLQAEMQLQADRKQDAGYPVAAASVETIA